MVINLILCFLRMIVFMFILMIMTFVIMARTTAFVLMVMILVTMIMSAATTWKLTPKMEMAFAWVQNFHLYKVENQSHDCNDEHEITFDSGWLEKALSSFYEKPYGHDPYWWNWDQSSDDLSSMPSVGQMRRWASLSKRKSSHRDSEPHHVWCQVCRVSVDGYGSSCISSNQLRCYEENRDKCYSA